MPTLYNVETRKPETLDGPDLQLALAKGTHSYAADAPITVTDPNGNRGTIPSANVRQALAQGYSVETPTESAINQFVDENKGLKGAAKVAAGEFANQALFGLPEIILRKTMDPLDVAKAEALRKEHSFADITGGVAGFGTSLFTGAPLFRAASAAGEKTAGMIAERIIAASTEEISKRSAMAAARDILGNYAARGVGGAVEGGVLVAPHAITETMLGDPEQAAETLLAGVGIGTAFGAGGALAKDLFKLGSAGTKAVLTAGKDASEAVGSTAQVAARKAASVATGIPEADILHYTQNLERANTNHAVYSELGGGNAIEGVKAEIDDVVSGFKDKINIASKAAENAKLELDQAYNIEKQRLAQTRAPSSLAPEIMGELENTKIRLKEKSDELFRALDGNDIKIKTSDLDGFVTKQMDSLRPTKDAAVFGETAKAEHARLERLQKDLKTLPEELDLNTAKGIIKQMDPDLNFSYGAGEFNELSQRNGKAFRKFMNDQLRQSPEAAAILDEMSHMSQVLSRASKAFGTIEKATSNVNNIFSPRGQLNKEILNQLGSMSGKDFTAQLAEMEKAKSLLEKSRVQDIRGELFPSLTQKQADLEKQVQELQRNFEPLKSLTPQRTQGILRNQGFATPNIENRKALDFLSEVTGKNYHDVIKDVNTVDKFAKSSITGSRKTLLGAAVGSAIGGPVGGALGSAIGAAGDIYGGQVLKKLIDAAPDVSGLLFAEKAMKDVAMKLDTIPTILSNMADKVPVKGTTASLEALLRINGEREQSGKTASPAKRAEELKKLTEKVSMWAANPAAAMHKIQQLTGPLISGGAPVIGAALGAKYTQATNYLYSAVPKPPRPNSPFAAQYKWKPSDSELAAFEQKLQTVMDPFSVLHELQAGTLTKNHMHALKQVYPVLHQKIQQKVQGQVLKGVKPISYQHRIKLSLLMDAPMDSSMTGQAILDFQKSYVAPQQNVDMSSIKDVHVAKEMASDVQKLMG